MNHDTRWKLIYVALWESGMFETPTEGSQKTDGVMWRYMDVEEGEEDADESVEGTVETEAGEEQESAGYELPGIAEDRLPAEEN